MQLELEVVRELSLRVPPQPGRALHLSAASGLVKVGSRLYVVADDELHLGVFPATGDDPGTLIRMFEGELPHSPQARKRHKPDVEALVRLPPFAHCQHGALLALGSGSKQQRCRGVLMPLEGDAVNVAKLQVLDVSDWFASICGRHGELDIPKLNVEGAVLCGDRLVLMHRGNKSDHSNCLISFGLHEVLESIASHCTLPRVPMLDTRGYDLGTLAGVPLCFTDGAGLADGRLVFAAVAEDTADSYLDGPCRGAVIGVIGNGGQLEGLYPLEQNHKVEGVHAELEDLQVKLWLVTDADDPQIPAKLLHGVLPS